MKLKNLFPFAAALVLPLSVISCGDDETKDEKKDDKKEESTGGAPGAPAAKDHSQIGKEVGAIMDNLIEQMSSISDKKSAEEFIAGFGEQKASLAALLKAAKELDPPTAEEKAAVQAMKEASDKKGEALMGKMMQMMAENPDAEEIGKIMGSVMSDKEMDEVTNGLEALYELEDSADEDPGIAPE